MDTNETNILSQEEKEKLVDRIEDLLYEYDYDYNRSALSQIVDTWSTNKANLINAFKKHPNYIEGKYMIAFDVDFTRVTDVNKVRQFIDWILWHCAGEIEYRDNLPDEVKEMMDMDRNFLPPELYTLIQNLADYTEQFISEELANEFDAIVPNAHFHKGAKTTRSINRLFKYLGYDKHIEYNREFTKYCDAINPLTIKRHTIISLNPLDYLTMSFGNSWASCHTIDTQNKRGMPNGYRGMYSSGTMSYMLDSTSIIMYTVDAAYDGDDYSLEPKVNRQMFHYDDGMLIQARLYPEDYLKEIIDSFRQIMQEIVSKTFEFNNLWSLKRGTSAICNHVSSYGTHYRDYTHFSNCTISFAKEIIPEEDRCEHVMDIGHRPICIECGYEHSHEDNINCCHSNGQLRCADCGCLIDEDDAYWVDGEAYCCDCVSYCDHCGEYYHNRDMTYVESADRYVCDWCLENYYTYCDVCGEYYHNDDIRPVTRDGEEIEVCDYCYEEHCVSCTECGEDIWATEAHEHNGDWYCSYCIESVIEEEEAV